MNSPIKQETFSLEGIKDILKLATMEGLIYVGQAKKVFKLFDSVYEENKEKFKMRDCKSFYIKDGMRLAVLDIALIHPEFVKGYYPSLDSSKTWFYFHRLNVPEKIRRKNHANNLLEEMCEWVDVNNVNIINEVSPYSDGGLDLKQLIKLYEKFGFVLINPDEKVMIREAKKGK